MKNKPDFLDSTIKKTTLQERPSKVAITDFGMPYVKGGRVSDFFSMLPHTLAANDLLEIASRVAQAVHNKRPVVLGMGGHVIKVGLNPLLIDLMRRGVITCLAMNGACVIHDTEIALSGKTSENVSANLENGIFGMAADAADLISRAVRKGADADQGMGEALGEDLLHMPAPHADVSLLAAAAEMGVPCTVHVSIGADIIHMHPNFDGAATGKVSHHDFKKLSSVITRLEGGVFLNVGSAVMIPEVFLKALSLVRNLGHTVENITTVNMDFIKHYRPAVNVVERPTSLAGKGFHLIGHHEIMIPLLCAAIIEKL